MSPKTRGPNKSERITLRLRPDQLDALQSLVNLGVVDSISSAVRESVRDYIRNKVPQAPTVKATETNLEALVQVAMEKALRMQTQAAVKKARKELGQA